uniref:Evasin n=1 Tax=Rhipicephalus zambeziensis TaxID=60191 RepID=A0A224Y5W0_9ACAR
MVRRLVWAALFPFIACNHPYWSVPANGIHCQQFALKTPVGTKIVGCRSVCNFPDPVKEDLSGRQCVNASPEAVPYMTSDVNYTCELGVCVGNKCDPFDLFIGCWKS